jgi:peptidoglycan hydrolase CwlO-like protein
MTGKEDKSIDECLLEPENSFLRDKIQEHVSKIEEMQRRREELEKTVDEMHKKLEELSEQKENTTTKLQRVRLEEESRKSEPRRRGTDLRIPDARFAEN